MSGLLELDLSLRLRAEAVEGLLTRTPGARIADVGCATGALAARLARRGRAVTAVDVSARNLAGLECLYPELVAAGSLVAVRGDLTKLPLASGSFGAAVCLEVLEHLEDDRRAAAELARILRPGGLLVVSVPNRAAPPPLLERLGLESVHDAEGPERHVRPGYEPAELEALLREAGFRTLSTTGVGGPAYRLAAGVVSLVHLAYRRARSQRSWTWADVEADAASPLLRAYRRLFPLLFAVARAGAQGAPGGRSTLVAAAIRL